MIGVALAVVILLLVINAMWSRRNHDDYRGEAAWMLLAAVVLAAIPMFVVWEFWQSLGGATP